MYNSLIQNFLTPLYYAIRIKSIKMILFLLRNGANPFANKSRELEVKRYIRNMKNLD